MLCGVLRADAAAFAGYSEGIWVAGGRGLTAADPSANTSGGGLDLNRKS